MAKADINFEKKLWDAGTYHEWLLVLDNRLNNVIPSDRGTPGPKQSRARTVIAKSNKGTTRQSQTYENQPGFCHFATLAEVQKQDYKLTPGIYVGSEEEVDDCIPFEEKMEGLKAQLMEQFERSSELQERVKSNLEKI